MTDYSKALAKELDINEKFAAGAIALLEEGNTVPFIARYRKEATGSMDDQLLRKLADRLDYLKGLDKRREEIKAQVEAQGAMTEDLMKEIDSAQTLARLEDVYRPYKPKRKTRAMIARQKGLEPLASLILLQDPKTDPLKEAERFVNEEVPDAAAAIAGAKDIIAELISDDAEVREKLRTLAQKTAVLRSAAVKPDEDSVYRLYYDYTEAVSKAAGHRVLAVNRGEKEGILKVSVEIDPQASVKTAAEGFVRGNSACSSLVSEAAEDACKRLILPSLENEIRSGLTDAACEGAISVFADNLRQLLLQPPVKGKVVMGLDPGYRMGCKTCVVDPTGRVLATDVIFPVPEFKRVAQAKAVVSSLIKKHKVEVLAIGNGTASKETEIFAADVIRDFPGVQYAMVNEAGASVYSASELAAKEFPQFDVNLRSSVSIARRLQDPLAELVKIDPKAVGVGQYQHDMPQKRLAETLDGVVEDCVNSVGVDLNTASAALLTRVAGLSASVAANIVSARETAGEFKSRTQLLKVKGLGPKAFTQCAGFLRIPGAKEKLDETSVHPESYEAARALLKITGFDEDDIGSRGIETLPQRIKLVGWDKVCRETGAGRPTLEDIAAELVKPGRDMRDSLDSPILRSDILSMEDLKEGMELTGTVRNVTDFGAFVDIGVHQDGLVHISRISKRFIKHPKEVLKVGMVIKVRVLGVEPAKKRISLTAQNCGNDF